MNKQYAVGSITIKYDAIKNQWLIYHSDKISLTMVKLEKWFQNNLPISENEICFINQKGKSYKTNLLECFNVIAFLKN